MESFKEPKINWAIFKENSPPFFILNSIFGITSDNIILFTNLDSGEQTFYLADGGDNGDGIRQATGSILYPIFAFAERKFNPRIFILNFPGYTKLHIISGENICKIICLQFTESEYLMATTGYPQFKLKIWNYRLGTVILEEETNIRTEKQKILCNTSPLICAQYAPNLAKLIIWEIHSALEQGHPLRRFAITPFLTREKKIDFCFGNDSSVYIVDSIGNFYSIHTNSGSSKEQFHWANEIGEHQTSLCAYQGGFVIVGSNSEIVYIKKTGSFYRQIWNLKTEYPIYWINSIHNYEKLYGLNQNSTLLHVEYNQDLIQIHQITESDNLVLFFDIINPHGKYIAIVTGCSELRVLKCENKNRISTVKIPEINLFQSHPSFPILIFSDLNGRIFLYSVCSPESPSSVLDFKLSNNLVKQIDLTDHFMVVYDFEEFFIIKTDFDIGLELVSHIKCEYDVSSFSAIEDTEQLQIFGLIQSSKDYASEEILVITINSKFEYSKKKFKLPDKYVSIKSTYDGEIMLTGCDFFCHFLQVTNKIEINKKIKIPHQIKLFKADSNKNLLFTWGFDGLVTVLSSSGIINCIILAINRRSDGDAIQMVKITPNNKYCFVKTKKGVMKSFILEELDSDEMENENAFQNYFKKPIKNLVEDSNYTWIEMHQMQQNVIENKKFAESRSTILKELNKLREQTKILIDENEALESEQDRLNLSDFNMAKDWSNDLIQKAKELRELEEKTLRQYIQDQNNISKYVIQLTWSKMKVNSSKIYGIYSNIMCENYSLANDDVNAFKDQLEKIGAWRDNEKEVYPDGFCYPWETIVVKPEASQEDEIDEATEENKEFDMKKITFALSGTATYKFIEPHPLHYQQLELVSFRQMFIENLLTQQDLFNLKGYFNKEFSGLFKDKEEQLKYVKQKNERLRHIQNEKNALQKLRNSTDFTYIEIDDPDFSLDEKPKDIIKVEDFEIKIKPYISPSQQRILDEIAYKEEMRRLLLLADDFCERALIKMMDGVLEKKWEDEIKKEPPLPECIVKNKDPSEYTKDDVKAIKEYEDRIKYNLIERAKYQILLEEEQKKIKISQHDQIMKFNMRCVEIFIQKLKVEAAVKQEELKLIRLKSFNFERISFRFKETELNRKAAFRKEQIEHLHNLLEEIDTKLQDCRGRYEALQTRDRLLDKQFKSSFSENAPNFIIDQAYKIFKRRPKWPQRAWATAAICTEMANRVIQKNSSKSGIPLPEECYEFLNLVDNIDSYSTAPNVIDQKLWEVLCRLRRIKIENEFKLKACGAQLAECEAAANSFVKALSNKKIQLSSTEKESQDLNHQYNEHMKNRTVQIVLPMGYVEVDLSGSISDFNNCILLSVTDVADINAIIKKTGAKKLKAMEKVAHFRRKVLFKEWEHKMLQMSVQDLKNFLSTIEHSKISIEMLKWLRDKSENRLHDINRVFLEKEVENKISYLKNQLSAVDKKIEEVEKKIKDQKEQNKLLDDDIQNININVTEHTILRDIEFEENQQRQQKERMTMIIERAKLVRKVQSGHAHLLELGTLLELQRLRTFPTLTSTQKSFTYSC